MLSRLIEDCQFGVVALHSGLYSVYTIEQTSSKHQTPSGSKVDLGLG